MCAEFVPSTSGHDLESLLLGITLIRKILDGPRKRVFPRQNAPILIPQKNSNKTVELIESEFSLIPHWWKADKGPRPVFATHNARLESILEKPTFRDAFKQNPCIVPMESFFESSLFGKSFAGHRIRIHAQSTLFAAGCTSDWINKSTGEVISTFTILTKIPGPQIFAAGHDRSPVFLNSEKARAWLQSEGLKPQEKLDFLYQNESKDLKLEIEVDRALKAGWAQRAPSEDEILELQKQILEDKPKKQ